jgi:hypothetical protein
MTRDGASAARLGRLEQKLGVRLPADFRELYLLSDGLEVAGLALDFFDVERIEACAGQFGARLGHVGFADRNDSNPYTLCCNEPVRGLVVHVHHDDQSQVICWGLSRFLELVAERLARSQGTAEDDTEEDQLDFIGGDLTLNVRERTEEDARAARGLLDLAARINPLEPERTEALRYAAHLFGEGQEEGLAALLEDNEYVSATALARLRYLDTPRARQLLAAQQADLARFVDQMAVVLRGAGMEVRRQGNEVTVQPGNIHLNVPLLYGSRRQANFFDDLLARVRRWQAERR